MKKSMYSLMLMDDVIKEVDKYAYRQRTSRSNLINQIVAEYLNVNTPEMVYRKVFDTISKMLDEDIFQIVTPMSHSVFSFNSCLSYPYQPTVKYNIELNRDFKENIGQLSVVFRTQSSALLLDLSNFFTYWIELENEDNGCIASYNPLTGRYIRCIRLEGNYSYYDISLAIKDYINLFDGILKRFLTKEYKNKEEMRKDYITKKEKTKHQV